MFDSLLTTTFSTKRLTNISGTNKTELVENLVSQSGMIQPLGDEELIGGERLGQLFKLFCNRIDIITNDRIYIVTDEYTVKSIKDFNMGSFPHFEIILAKIK
jgi:hypothetical protein